MKITFNPLLSVIYIVRRSPNSNMVSANEKPLWRFTKCQAIIKWENKDHSGAANRIKDLGNGWHYLFIYLFIYLFMYLFIYLFIFTFIHNRKRFLYVIVTYYYINRLFTAVKK